MAFQVTLHQMTMFFLVLAIGFIAGKTRIIEKDYLPHLAKLITTIFLPVMIFAYTCNGSTREALLSNWRIIVFSAVFYAAITVIMYALAKLLSLPHDRDRVFTFCFAFGNTGFVGTPLLAALYPEGGLLYVGMFGLIDIAYFWTGGLFWASARDRKFSLSLKEVISPNVIAIALAFTFILLELRLPAVIDDTLMTIADATGACCMVYLGAMLAFSKWVDALKCKELYVGILVKMVIVPLIGGHILLGLGWPTDVAVSMIVIMALPTITIAPMIAAQYGKEGDYAAGLTVGTLLAGIVTIPLVLFLMGV